MEGTVYIYILLINNLYIVASAERYIYRTRATQSAYADARALVNNNAI